MEKDQVSRYFGEERFARLSALQQRVVTALCCARRYPLPVWSELSALDESNSDRVSLMKRGVARCLDNDMETAVKLWEMAAAAFEPYSVFFLALTKQDEQLFVRAAELGMVLSYSEAAHVLLRRNDINGAKKCLALCVRFLFFLVIFQTFRAGAGVHREDLGVQAPFGSAAAARKQGRQRDDGFQAAARRCRARRKGRVV
jgi:hypothetical protein